MHRALQGRCGLFCGDCKIYIAYATDDIESRRNIALECRGISGKAIAPDQVKCLGCKSPDSSCWRSKCKIRACAEERGMEFCYQCRAYSCDILQEFHEQHPEAKENLKMISKLGPDAWLLHMLTKNRKNCEDESSE
jgi:hypothetical protein